MKYPRRQTDNIEVALVAHNQPAAPLTTATTATVGVIRATATSRAHKRATSNRNGQTTSNRNKRRYLGARLALLASQRKKK